jgi:hypothetical protein
MLLLTTVPPFAVRSGERLGYFGEAAIPERPGPEDPGVPRRHQPRFVVLIGLGYPAGAGTAWDFHRSMSSAVVTRRHHQPPRMAARRNRNAVLRERALRVRPMLPLVLELGTHTRPKRDPSRSDPVRPLRQRPLPDAAGSASRGRWTGFSGRERPRPGRIGSSLRRTAPFETKPTTPAAHTARSASKCMTSTLAGAACSGALCARSAS